MQLWADLCYCARVCRLLLAQPFLCKGGGRGWGSGPPCCRGLMGAEEAGGWQWSVGGGGVRLRSWGPGMRTGFLGSRTGRS